MRLGKTLYTDKYLSAIIEVKRMIEKESPIRTSEFAKTHKLNSSFFRLMEDLKMIKREVMVQKEGSLFSWCYKSSGEKMEALAVKITDAIYDQNRECYLKYLESGNIAANRKRRLSAAKEEFKDKKPQTIFKNIHDINPIVAPTILKSAPEEIRIDREVLVAANAIMEETPVAVSVRVETQKKESTIADKASPVKHLALDEMNFSFSGGLTKTDLMEKIRILIDDKTISSISLKLSYDCDHTR